MFARVLAAAAAVALLASCATTGERGAAVERMYVIDCGENHVTDLSRWSPGVNVGQPKVFGNHCYLVRHARGWFLWETGNSDALAARPNGLTVANGLITVFMKKPLAASLKELGLAPGDIRHLAMSHSHGDHAGNANLFAGATWYVQAAEHDAIFGGAAQKYGFMPAAFEKLRATPTVRLSGDHDVFGDGSVRIVATLGHTPGHQSLLVRLPKSGAVLLSGDMVHYQDNWKAKRVPVFNFDKDASLRSMQAVEELLARSGAKLWIGHDKEQHASIPKAPRWVE